ILAGVPTVSEFLPGFEASNWFGVAAPRNTSPEIIDKLNKEINVALGEPDIKARLADLGAGSLTRLLKKVFEGSRWATLIQDPSARRTKDSQPSGFGFEYCASHVRFRVFQQTVTGSPADFGRFIAAEAEKWSKVIRAANIKVD